MQDDRLSPFTQHPKEDQEKVPLSRVLSVLFFFNREENPPNIYPLGDFPLVPWARIGSHACALPAVKLET